MTMVFSSDSEEFAEYYAEAEPSAKVHSATTWAEQLEALADEPERITGAKLPWKSTHLNVRFRPGEVTLWAGMNGSGKSQMLGNVVLGFCAQQETSRIASFEMSPIKTLERMQRQASMVPQPARQFTKQFTALLDGKLWIYDQQGQVEAKTLYAVVRYAGRKLKVRHMVVDNLAEVCARRGRLQRPGGVRRHPDRAGARGGHAHPPGAPHPQGRERGQAAVEMGREGVRIDRRSGGPAPCLSGATRARKRLPRRPPRWGRPCPTRTFRSPTSC